MPRGSQIARLYTLVMDLARTRHGLPVETLARRRGWRTRTVYRDLHALEDAGFPVARGDGARWKLADGWEARIPFPMPLGQLLALHVAGGLMAPLRGTPLARDFEELRLRLSGERPAAARGQGELFPRYRALLATRSTLAIDYGKHAAVLETLCRACERRVSARVLYHAGARRETTRRRIDPYCLYYDAGLEALYVFAWCHLRKAMRTFAVHRFRRATLTDRPFEPPADFTPEGYLRGAFRIWRGANTVRVRLAVDREAAGWVSERRWHSSQQIRRRPGGACELALTVDGVQEVKRFILQLGAAVEVLEPAWLRAEVAREHAAAARRGRGARRGAQRLEILTPDDTRTRHSG